MPENNAPATEKSEELKKAEEALAISKAQKEKADNDKIAAQALVDKVKAEHERERLEATGGLGLLQAQVETIAKLLPKGETKPLEGKVEAKDVGSIARLAAFHAIRAIAADVATTLLEKIQDNDTVMIVPQLDFATGDLPLAEIMEQFRLLEQSLTDQVEKNKTILGPSPPPSSTKAALASLPAVSAVAGTVAIAGSLIQGLANLAGYFKTDYAITGYEFDLDKECLAARVANALAEGGKEVYFYNFYTLWGSQTPPVIEKFAQLSQLSLEIEALKGCLTVKKNQGGPNATTDVDRAIKDSQTLLDIVKTYMQSITTKTAGEDYSKLVRAALRDRMHQMGITHLLYLNILPKSGGESISKKKIWTTHETIGYLGGAAVSYVFAEKDGRIITSDLLVRLSICNYRLADPEKSTITSIPFS